MIELSPMISRAFSSPAVLGFRVQGLAWNEG